MRILITTISYCEYVIQQANALAGIGHSVLLVIPTQLIRSTVGDHIRLLSPSVNYYAYDLTKRKRFDLYSRLFQTVSDFSPDILHIHENGELETLALALRFRSIPLAVSVHDVIPHPGNDSIRKLRRVLIEKWIRKCSDSIHLHGVSLQENLRKLSPGRAQKSYVIPHGSLSLFKHMATGGIAREPSTCLFFGRMEKYRGLDNLLRIASIVKETVPGIKIIVAGTGSELTRYKSSMADLGVFEIYDSFIADHDVFRFFGRASLLLLPYKEASQSGVVMMGLPFGVPVVANAVGSIPEIIVSGKHGEIVPTGDIRDFADAIRALLADKERWERMSANCLELAEQLDFHKLAHEFVALYAQCVANKERPMGKINDVLRTE